MMGGKETEAGYQSTRQSEKRITEKHGEEKPQTHNQGGRPENSLACRAEGRRALRDGLTKKRCRRPAQTAETGQQSCEQEVAAPLRPPQSEHSSCHEETCCQQAPIQRLPRGKVFPGSVFVSQALDRQRRRTPNAQEPSDKDKQAAITHQCQ